jgi:hypothetical protein
MPAIPLRGIRKSVRRNRLLLSLSSALTARGNFTIQNLVFAGSRFFAAVANAFINQPLFRVTLNEFFDGQAFMPIANIKHEYIISGMPQQVQGGTA